MVGIPLYEPSSIGTRRSEDSRLMTYNQAAEAMAVTSSGGKCAIEFMRDKAGQSRRLTGQYLKLGLPGGICG
jgi:hypothetical protein